MSMKKEHPVWIPKGTYYYIENYNGRETIVTDIKVA